jgi:beta-lactamase class A
MRRLNVVGVVSVGVSLVVAFLGGRLTVRETKVAAAAERAAFRGAVLTSPFLESAGSENSQGSLTRARADIAEAISIRERSDPTLQVSVYARDLEHGGWIGINDRALFSPWSLIKVAVLIHTLEREDSEPGILDREVHYSGGEESVFDDTMRGAPDSLRLQPGTTYTYRDLLRRMIEYSDNHATQLLLQGEGAQGISEMLYNLSAEQIVKDDTFYFDAHTVAAMLRSLYHGSFLGRVQSEFALDLLTKSRFEDGLRRYLPPDTRVASKFGYHTATTDSGTHVELHECGIVYAPQAPYVVCVMTATDRDTVDELGDLIGEVSRILWSR